MAEGLLRSYLAQAGVPASVGSAGLLPGGSPATGDAIGVMSLRGIDIRRHRSRTLDPAIARSTPLVIGMTRHHVREACVTYGAPIERTFTLKELVRRGEQVGPRAQGETVSSWLARVGTGRQTSDLLGDNPADDVADPVGRPREVYERTVVELEDLLSRLVDLLVGDPGVPNRDEHRVGGPTSGEHRATRPYADSYGGHFGDPGR
jgi:protein-tyrosine phosphatase